MTSFQDNKLLFNNPFLQNHPLFKKPQHLLTPDERAKLTEINRHIERLQSDFERKVSHLDKPNDRNKIVEKVIAPVKIVKKKNEKITIDNYKEELPQLWKQRTNQPYKNILKNENYNKDFKSKEDLVVHRVTTQDKQGLDENFNKFQHVIDNQNNEIQSIYSQTKKTDHLKQFEYNHKYKYRIQSSSTEHDDMKSDTLEYYKQEQQKQENEKIKVDQIIESMLSNGIIEGNTEQDNHVSQTSKTPDVTPPIKQSKGIRTIKRL